MPRQRDNEEEEVDDMEGLAEQELQKLSKAMKFMENDRNAYTEESQNVIRKQRAEIAMMEREQEELNKELRLIESESNNKKDEIRTQQLGELARQKNEIEAEINSEKQKQEELKEKLKEQRKKNSEQQKKMGGIHMSSQHSKQVTKNARKKESQLQLAKNRFSKLCAENGNMRKEIDSLRVERQRFDRLNKKLEKELDNLKQEIGAVIDESTQAYDSREEAQAKMILLREKADKDVQQHNAEMKELVRIIDHDRKLREFMTSKGRERQEDPQLVKWRQEKEDKEAQKKKESQTDSVESYEAAFERIKEITEEEDIDLIVRKFIEVEDKNFALFNYVNEQNNQIELLQENIQEIEDSIDKFKSEGVELEEERQQQLNDIEEMQANTAEQAKTADENHKGVSKILDQLRAGVESLFSKLSCDKAAIDDMLGKDAGVTDQSMLQYLGVIEEKTNELLMMQAFLQQQKDEETTIVRQSTLLGDGPQAAAHQVPILPPAVGDDIESDQSGESDDENRPKTRHELMEKAMKSVRKREAAIKKEGFRYDLSDAREKARKPKKK